MTYAWLKCLSLNKNMFSDEKIAIVSSYDGNLVEAYFVPSTEVDEETVSVKVEVTDHNGKLWATVPHTIPTMLPVNREDLVFIPGS